LAFRLSINSDLHHGLAFALLLVAGTCSLRLGRPAFPTDEKLSLETAGRKNGHPKECKMVQNFLPVERRLFLAVSMENTAKED